MSTKIYTAWRCKIPVFTNVFLPKFRQEVFSAVTTQMRRIMRRTTVTDQDRYKLQEERQRLGLPSFSKSHANKHIQFDRVFACVKKASESKFRDTVLCFDLSLNFWIYQGRVYIVPCGEQWLWDTFDLPDGVEDYSYWNNVEQPEGMTDAEWERRERTWLAVCLDKDWDEARFTHTIIDSTQYSFRRKLLQRVFARGARQT